MAAQALLDQQNTPCFSTVTLWELSIKFALRRHDPDLMDPRLLRPALLERGYVERGVTAEHALAVADLPLHHRDPFDRMLITQARIAGIPFMTADKALARYGAPVRLVG
jgi:PIN domain nuclease of toxin-antitoxin system